MTNVSSHPTPGNGKICYIELPSIEVFGWHIRNQAGGEISFDDTVGEVSGRFVQGRKAVSETGLLVYIMVDNAEATINSICQHGGVLVQPIGIQGSSRKYTRNLPGAFCRITIRPGLALELSKQDSFIAEL